MTGRIRQEDVDAVKERVAIEDIVREHVTMRPAGPGRLKGLCPFHDEKTPSFTVRPAVGVWHCFGCNEGGDVISFVQKIDHITFVEAIERLAGAAGVQLRYEDGSQQRGEGPGRRARLLEAHRVAENFYHECLLHDPDARVGRDFLRARGFDSASAAHFGVGYAPRSGHHLVTALRAKGFTEDEAIAAGLCSRGQRGGYDRFRGRLMWPIRDITGDTVGFGARRLYQDDRIEAKYLNTSETPIYRKASLLYGLDLAKRSIARDRQVVIVEGYTDVMACHLAGVETAVATCGTAFGVDHIKTLRRIMRDEVGGVPARAVFTFDGDAAGQRAAMKAFEEDQRWGSQSFVAVAADGMDPCELRQHGGDAAVRALIEDAVPMFEFAVRTTLARFELSTAEGRVAAMSAVGPIVAGIRDRALHAEYTRTVAGWIGVDVEQVASEVARAARAGTARAHRGAGPGPAGSASLTMSAGRHPGVGGHQGGGAGVGEPGPDSPEAGAASGAGMPDPAEPAPEVGFPIPDLNNPAVDVERQLLQVMIQFPDCLSVQEIRSVPADAWLALAHRAIHAAIVQADPEVTGRSSAAWVEQILTRVPEAIRGLVIELSVAVIKGRLDPTTGRPDDRYVEALLARVHELCLSRLVAEGTSELRRTEGQDPDRAAQVSARLAGYQRRLHELRVRMG